MMLVFYIFICILYLAISIVSLIVGVKELENGEEWKVSIGTILFPMYYIPYLFTYNLRGSNKELCICNKCNTKHRSYRDKFIDICK